jgi:uncharacterized protein YcgI (DUF1989 family)
MKPTPETVAMLRTGDGPAGRDGAGPDAALTRHGIRDGKPAAFAADGEPVRIEPRTGMGVRLKAGDRLRIVDPEGEQVSDLLAFDAEDPREVLSSGRTIDYNNSIYLREGDTLYSNRSTPMLKLVRDTAGEHDFLLTPCSPEMFRKLYGINSPRPSCFGNLVKNLEPMGIAPDQIGTTLNVFMSVRPDGETGELTIGPPSSGPGDAAEFEVLRDLIVGVTACSAEKSNNGSFKPIDVQIRAAGGKAARV